MNAAPGRVRRAGVVAAARAFLARDLRVEFSYRVPFFLEIAGIAFTVLIQYFVAKLVIPGLVPGGYFTFVLIGVAMSVFMASGISLLAVKVREEQLQGTLEALIGSGLPLGSLAVGLAVFPMLSAVWTAAIYLAVGAVFGAETVPGADWSLALAALVLGAVSFVGIGLVGIALVLVFRRAAAATGWLVAVLALAGGEYFPADVLPGWFASLAQLSPYTQALHVARAALLEEGTWAEEGARMLLLASMAVAAVAFGLGALILGLRYARRAGTLAQY